MRPVVLSFLARLATFPVTAIATFVSAAVVIGYGGAEDYGAVMLVGTLFQFIPFADLGLGAVVVNSLATANLSTEFKQRTTAAVVRYLCISGAIVSVVGLAGASLFSWGVALGIAGIAGIDAATALALLIFAVSVPLSVGQRILTGLGKNPVAVLISTVSSLATLLATVVLAALSAPIALVAVATPFGILVSSAISFEYGRRLIGMRWSDVSRPAFMGLREMLRTGAPMLVVMVGLPIAIQSGRVFLSHLKTPIPLSEFTLGMQLYTPIWSFVTVASAALWPVFTRHLMDKRASRNLLMRAAVAFGVAGLIGAGGIVVVGPWLADVISSGDLKIGGALTLSLGTLLAVQSLQQVPGMYLTTPSGLRFQAICVVALVVFVLLGNALAVPLIGAPAPPLVLAVGVFVCQLIPGIIRVIRDQFKPGSFSGRDGME